MSTVVRPRAKYIEKYSNALQLLSLINDYNYITITGPAEMLLLVVGFVALRPKSTAMVIAGRSVHLTTLFPGHA